MPTLSFLERGKRQRQQQEQQQERDRQLSEQLQAQEQRIRVQAAELERFKQQVAEQQAQQRHQFDQQQRKQQADERRRAQDENFLENQARLKIEVLEAQRQDQKTKISAENVRKLRALIKTRHDLDITIWNERNARQADRELTLKRMDHADAVMVEIRAMIQTWDREHFDREDWRVAKKIKECLQRNDKRVWENNPPWNDR